MMPRSLPIAVRFFLLTFVPVSLALIGGFWLFGKRIEDDVRSGFAGTLAESQQAQLKLREEGRKQQQLLVAGLSENPALKAGVELWRSSNDTATAQRTIQDQLQEIGDSLNAGIIAMYDDHHHPVAGLARRGDKLESVPGAELPKPADGLSIVRGVVFDAIAVPLNLGDENLGYLLVGKRFDAASFNKQSVLVRGTQVIASSGVAASDLPTLGQSLRSCEGQQCSVRIAGDAYLALHAKGAVAGTEYAVWTLHSVEAASSQLLGTAREVLWAAMFALLIAALLAHLFGGRSVVKPLAGLIGKLRESETSGVLRGDFPENSTTREVNDLAHAFNMAARSVAESQRRLDEAYLQFTQTMAQTLDARDAYTAGHSSRVGGYAKAIATAMNLSAKEVENVQVGANLHDIGKIGIPDSVLQKPAALTEREFEIIKTHPLIGKRILEGVAKFRDYLSIVELHHENHDGSGYPWGLRGDNVPLGARIVHVVDAYDAMTTSRPYRQAMEPERAQAILRTNAGTQFDPAVVEVFLRLLATDPSVMPALQKSAIDDVPRQLAVLNYSLDGVAVENQSN